MHALLLRIFGSLPRFLRARIVRMLYPTFTAGTSVILRRPDGRVLLVTQSYSHDWSLPGGLMGRHETPAQAAAREVAEEVAIHIDLGDQHPIPIRGTRRRHFTFVFLTDIDDAVARSARSTSAEITALGWFCPANLPDLFDDTELYFEAYGLTPVLPGTL